MVFHHNVATQYKWAIRLGLLTPILVALCVFLMGGGHGWYIPTIVLFPWSMLNITWQDHLSEPLLYAGLFQFVIYGLFLDKTSHSRYAPLTVASIVMLHVFLVVLILMLRQPGWR